MHWCILQITYHLSSSARHCTSQHMDAMVRLLHSTLRELLLLRTFQFRYLQYSDSMARTVAAAWNYLGWHGFPAMTVPAGWTTHVYDTEAVAVESAAAAGSAGGNQVLPSRLVGPVPAVLPVGMDIVGRPFAEPVLLQIGAVFEAATHHRRPPTGFASLRQDPCTQI